MSESRAWFRLYTEFASDPKVQLLDETLQRRFIMLLCLAGAGVTPTNSVSEVDFLLRIGVSECERTRSILVSKGLIDETWFPRKWKKRQFESDISTERVKRFRQRSKAVADTVTETPSEQSRTEQSQKRATRIPEDFVLTDDRRLVAEAERLPAERTFEKFSDYWRAASGSKARKPDWDATWRNRCRHEGERQAPLKVNGASKSPYKGAI